MLAFLKDTMTHEGAESMITPREIIRDFVTLLDLLYTNPDKSFEEIAGTVERTTAAADVDEAEEVPTPARTPKITLDDIEF